MLRLFLEWLFFNNWNIDFDFKTSFDVETLHQGLSNIFVHLAVNVKSSGLILGSLQLQSINVRDVLQSNSICLAHSEILLLLFCWILKSVVELVVSVLDAVLFKVNISIDKYRGKSVGFSLKIRMKLESKLKRTRIPGTEYYALFYHLFVDQFCI